MLISSGQMALLIGWCGLVLLIFYRYYNRYALDTAAVKKQKTQTKPCDKWAHDRWSLTVLRKCLWYPLKNPKHSRPDILPVSCYFLQMIFRIKHASSWCFYWFWGHMSKNIKGSLMRWNVRVVIKTVILTANGEKSFGCVCICAHMHVC